MKELDAYLKQDIPLVIHIGLITAITLMVYFVVNHAVNKFVDHPGSKDDFDTTNARFLLRVLNILIFMVGLGFIIFVVPMWALSQPLSGFLHNRYFPIS